MKLVEYTYTVVQYVHDPGAGETLNVGVVLFSPKSHYLKAEFCHTYERLSRKFVDFDGDHFKRAVRRFEYAISRLAERWTTGMFVDGCLLTQMPLPTSVLSPEPSGLTRK